MKAILSFIFWIAAVSLSIAGTWNTQQVFESSGTNDVPIVGYSESGASAGEFNQDTHFNSPAITITRSGTAGGELATSPIELIQAGQETTGTSPVLQVGGCTALTGDNWLITWGDGALSLPGGILDNTGKVHGNISIDPVHRQLVASDGITVLLSWANGKVTIPNLAVTGSSSGVAMGWYNPSLSATASGSVTVGSTNSWCVGMVPVAVSGSGSGFTYNLSISGSNAAPGAIARVDVDLKPNTTGTLNIYDAGGNLMQTAVYPYTYPANVECYMYFQAGFDGTHWHKETANWVQ